MNYEQDTSVVRQAPSTTNMDTLYADVVAKVPVSTIVKELEAEFPSEGAKSIRHRLNEANMSVDIKKPWDDEASLAWQKLACDAYVRFGSRFVGYMSQLLFLDQLRQPSIKQGDRHSLMWLARLYLGDFHECDQMTNLPFEVIDATPTARRIEYLFRHLRLLISTLDSLKNLYFADFIHLMSRWQSQRFLQRKGQYLLRLSNMYPTSLIVSTNENHYYLHPELFPGLMIVPQMAKVDGEKQTVPLWNLEMLRRVLTRHRGDMVLSEMVLTGGIQLHQLVEKDIDEKRSREYANCYKRQ